MKGLVEPISANQYMMVLFVSLIVGDVYIWPQFLTEHAGPDSLLVIAAATVLAAALMGVQAWWTMHARQPSLFAAFSDTWGHTAAVGLTSITLLLGLGLDSVLLALYSDMLQVFYYPETPRWATMALMVATAGWLAARTVSGVARNTQIWLPPALITFIAVVLASYVNVSQVSAVIPRGSIPPWDFMQATGATWFLFATAGLPASLLPHVRGVTTRRAVGMTIAVVATQGIILAMLLSLTVGTLGIVPTAKIEWPIVYVFSLVVLPTFFLRGVGLFIILSWTTVAVLFGATHFQNVLLNLGALSRPRRTLWATLLGGLLLIGAHEIGSVEAARELLFHVVTPLNFIWMLLVMPLTAAVSLLRRKPKVGKVAAPPPD